MGNEMDAKGTLLLRRHEIAGLLSMDECIQAVERTFRLQAEGRIPELGVLHVDSRG